MSAKTALPPEKHVVVLHGLGMNRVWMTGISGHLKKHGYVVHSLSYPSRAETFDALVDGHLVPLVKSIPADKMDFVGHSMGAVLVRMYAAKYGAAKIRRVVMLGPPNKGSQVADLVRGWPVVNWFYGSALQSLGTSPSDIHSSLPPVSFECGVIAGSNPWLHSIATSLLDVPSPHDGVVSVESTKVEGMKDHVVVAADHSQMVWSPKIWKLTTEFLDTGSFTGEKEKR